MPILIRPASLYDIPAILAIERNAPSASHWSLEQYKKLIDDNSIRIAEDEKALCGFISTKAVAGQWEIENVVVAIDNLRRGVADALFRDLLQRARQDAVSAVLLEVRQSNLPARQLYEKHGFSMAGLRRGYYQNPAEDAIHYTLHFNQ